MELVISLSIWIVSIIVFVIVNLYNKNVKLENTLKKQDDFIKNVLLLADNIEKTTQKIDSTLWVSNDPELKIVFEDVKSMQEHIKKFTGLI